MRFESATNTKSPPVMPSAELPIFAALAIASISRSITSNFAARHSKMSLSNSQEGVCAMLSHSMIEQIKCRYREFRREPSAFFWVMFMPVLFMVGLGFAFSSPHFETYGIGYIQSSGQSPWVEIIESTLTKDPQIKLRREPEGELQKLMMRGEIALILKIPADQNVTFELDTANPEAVRAQLFGVGMTIVSNRKENLLKRYLATPLRAYEYIVSHLFGRMMVLTAEFLAVMITGWLIFRFKVYGSWPSFVLFSILGAGAFTSIALLCAARTKSIPMISGLTNMISLPMMMLSGVFFSKNNFPDWLRHVTNFLPLTALNDGLRKIALEGLSIQNLGFEAAVLGAYLIIPALITARLFKWF
ncbi:MAG: ABC transporter permease [Proteobacteria bacterium]|nr:MAG: ABC transporter permease [Pseudomonadota bacterium]